MLMIKNGSFMLLFCQILQVYSNLLMSACTSTSLGTEKNVIKAQHQIYIDLRTLYTVAFHHQGIYSVKAMVQNQDNGEIHSGFPLQCKSPNHQLSNSQLAANIDYQKCTVQTKRFQVKHNAEDFDLTTKCRFSLQLQPKQQQQILIKLQLLKYPKPEPQPQSQSRQKNINSSQNFLKNENMEQYFQTGQNKNQSSTKDANLSQKKSKKQNKIKIVSSCKLKINLGESVKSNIEQEFRKMVFVDQEYFCILYVIISHMQVGYIVTPKTMNLVKFHKSQNKNARISVQKKLPTYSQVQAQKQKNMIIMALKQWQPSPKKLYKKLILQQLKKLQKLTEYFQQIQKQLLKQINFDKFNYKMLAMNHNSQSQKLNINLKQIYETQNLNQIYYLIYCEARAVYNYLFVNWQNLISVYSSSYLNAFYYKFLMRASRGQIQRLKSMKSTKQARQRLQKIERNSTKRLSQHLSSYIHRQNKNSHINDPNSLIRYNLFQLHPDNKMKYQSDAYNFFPTMEMVEKHPINYEQQIFNSEFINVRHDNSLFVLVHGLNGSEFDVSVIKSHINSVYLTNILTIKGIQKKFNLSLNQLGQIVAQQIKQYIQLNMLRVSKINFIGYSLGGVIIRASLKYLKQYTSTFNVMITLSSPHLGLTENKSCLVRTYTNMMNTFSRNAIMKDLHLRKSGINENQQDDNQGLSILQILAKDDLICNFNLVIFLGADKDQYVPLYSSTLSYKGQDTKIESMQKQLWSRVKNCHLININFNQKKKSTFLDKILLKKVHSNFLDDDSFLYFFFSHYHHLL